MEQPITFWSLITSGKKIVIPTIQRDYAQGRIGKEYLRCNFLETIKSALLDVNKPLTMDFVYGADEETRFVPLDGQQRLTTLWLLHWYVAYKSEILEEVREKLINFAYETRISSTQFCEALCSLMPQPIEINNNKNDAIIPLKNWIMQQTWFYHHYKQDPTIMAMINMICGTRTSDKEGQYIPDGLDEVFTDCDFNEMWQTLTTTNQLSFYKLKVSTNDSDELYVKMNARGRQLSDFENFKAELTEHVKLVCDEKYAIRFAGKMDVEWTDIFWPYKSMNQEDVAIDDIYFTFIRRFTSNECYLRYNEDEAKEKVQQILEEYHSFDIYDTIFTKSTIGKLEIILDRLCSAGIIDTSCSWEMFQFVPTYDEDHNVTEITEKQHLVFFAFCCYFEADGYDKKTFEEWKRVVWNLCENYIGFVPTLKLINTLGEHSHDILNYLSRDTYEWPNNKEQMYEEQQKARNLNNHPEIIDAERYAFFKGAIRFLFTDAEGKEDWSDFNTKWQNTQVYFNNNGVTDDYLKESFLLRRYIVLFKDNWYTIYDNNSSSWRERLLKKEFYWQNHHLLLFNDVLSYDYSNFISNDQDVKKKYAKEFLVRHDIFTNAVSGCSMFFDSKYCHGSAMLHPSGARAFWKYYILNPRTDFLFSDKINISFQNPDLENCRGIKLLFGMDINFAYDGYDFQRYYFQWYSTPNEKEADVYLMKPAWEDYHHRQEFSNEVLHDQQRYYCFEINAFQANIEQFQQKLEDLIRDYQKDLSI